MLSREKSDDILLPLAEQLPTEELPDGLRWLAERVGMHAVAAIIVEFDGLQMYVPKTIKQGLKRKYFIDHYDGHNARNLARLLNVAEPTVYRWLEDSKQPTAEQLDFFR